MYHDSIDQSQKMYFIIIRYNAGTPRPNLIPRALYSEGVATLVHTLGSYARTELPIAGYHVLRIKRYAYRFEGMDN